MDQNFRTDQPLEAEFAHFYRRAFNLPPLAAKIVAYLLFDFEHRGLTFHELTELFASSKSSVSSALNLLLDIGLIKDFTKPDERKRYFVNNPQYVRIRLENIVDKLKTEVDLLDRLFEFKENVAPDEYNKFVIYRSLLTNNITNIQDSLTKLYDEE